MSSAVVEHLVRRSFAAQTPTSSVLFLSAQRVVLKNAQDGQLSCNPKADFCSEHPRNEPLCARRWLASVVPSASDSLRRVRSTTALQSHLVVETVKEFARRESPRNQ